VLNNLGKSMNPETDNVNPDPAKSLEAAGFDKPAGSQPKGLKRFALSLLLVVGSLLICVTVIEVVLRLQGFTYQLRATVIEGTVPDPDSFYEGYAVDRDLIWVPQGYYESVEKMTAVKINILFLGDSCTQFGNYDRFFAGQVTAAFPDKRLNIGNFGVAGWTTHQGIKQMKRDVTKIKPDVATIYFGWNDHWNSIGIDDEDVSRLNASPLFNFQSLRSVQLITKAYVGFRRRQQDRPPLRVPIESFRNNLIQMVAAAGSMGTIPVLLTAPSSHQKGLEPSFFALQWVTDLDELVPRHTEYVNAVRQVAKENDVILCDLAAEFDKLPKEQVKDKLFMEDGVHLTDEGNKVIADFLFDCFRKNDLFKELYKGNPG
jgi:lysophospholipase L1-like esterase